MADVSLEHVVLQLAEANDKLDTINGNTDVSGVALLEIQAGVTQLVMQNADFIDILTGNKLLEEEQRREMLKLLSGLGGKGGGDESSSSNNNQQGGSDTLQQLGLMAGIAALAGLLTGAVTGYIKGVIKTIDKMFIRPFRTFFSGLFTRIFRALGLDELFGGLKKGFFDIIEDIKVRSYVAFDDGIRKPVMEFFDNIKARFFRLIEPVTKYFDDLKASMFGEGSVFARIRNVFANLFDKDAQVAVGSIKDALLSPFRYIKSLVTGGAGFLSPITGFFDDLIPFFDKFKALGRGLGKLFAPLGVILSIFDGVSEAQDAADKIGEDGGGFLQKLLGGVIGFIGGIIDGAIFQLGDLIKDGLSWVADSLGFSAISEALDSFSFSEMWNGVLDSIYELITNPIQWIKDKFQALKDGLSDSLDALVNIGGMVDDFMRSLLRSILPDPSGGWTSIQGVASKAIPSFIYEYAGLDPNTGEEVPQINNTNAEAIDTGAELNELFAAAAEAGISRDELIMQMASRGSVEIPNYGTVSASNGGQTITMIPLETRTQPPGASWADMSVSP